MQAHIHLLLQRYEQFHEHMITEKRSFISFYEKSLFSTSKPAMIMYLILNISGLPTCIPHRRPTLCVIVQLQQFW